MALFKRKKLKENIIGDAGEEIEAPVKKKKAKGRVIRSLREQILHEIVFVLFIVYSITLIYPFIFVSE